MRRQDLIKGPQPPTLWAVMDEAALRRPLGGQAVMRRQIEHLLEMSSLPHVALQVVPFDRGGHAAAGGPFSILRFAEPDLPDVVFLEQLSSALYLDDRNEVDEYMAVMDRLCVEAPPRLESVKVLHRILKDL
jgi:hypothetical protein